MSGPADGRDVVPGLEVLLRERRDLIAGRRVGLLANQASVTRDLRSSVDVLHGDPDVRLVALCGPEHGLRGAAQAGETVGAATDRRTGLTVYSLYGEQHAPSAAMLSTVDVLLCDVQDCGARYFTYPTTVLLSIRAAQDRGVRVVVLDRPNPLGGNAVSGGVLQPDYRSFVGAYHVAIRHGLTLGELARLAADDEGLTPPEVVPAACWRRAAWYDQTSLPLGPPSPNLPTLSAATLYPGTCLLEGTNVSEGRGTTQPFEVCGAPWIDGEALRALLAERLPAQLRPRACTFTPTFSKYAGQVCEGVALHVVDRDGLDPVAAGVHLLFALRDLYPARFGLRPELGEGGRQFLDLLSGSTALREALAAADTPQALLDGWQSEAEAFAERRRTALIYA